MARRRVLRPTRCCSTGTRARARAAFADQIAEAEGADDGSLPDVVPHVRYGKRRATRRGPPRSRSSAGAVAVRGRPRARRGTSARSSPTSPTSSSDRGRARGRRLDVRRLVPAAAARGRRRLARHVGQAVRGRVELVATVDQVAQLADALGASGRAAREPARRRGAPALVAGWYSSGPARVRRARRRRTASRSRWRRALAPALPDGALDALASGLVADVAARGGNQTAGILGASGSSRRAARAAPISRSRCSTAPTIELRLHVLQRARAATEGMWELFDAPFEGTGELAQPPCSRRSRSSRRGPAACSRPRARAAARIEIAAARPLRLRGARVELDPRAAASHTRGARRARRRRPRLA